MKRASWTLFVIALTAVAGCSTTQDQSKQLARVAKDWSMVIRASQVMPVYPLSEDVRPGDVFLVSSTLEEQISVFEENGFLPLDQLIARLQPTNYPNFYADTVIQENQFNAFTTNDAGGLRHFPTNAAPRAAFPNYNFEVAQGGGFNLGLPIQGVPVAFNFLDSSRASCSVALSDAFTYGVDLLSLRRQVEEWVDQPKNQAALVRFVASDPQAAASGSHYLRVINRVYLVGGVTVSVNSGSSFAFGASGGADQPVNTITSSTNAFDSYTNALSQLNASVANAATPGGSLKFASATSRGVSLVETFPRPLVVGYLAFDYPIQEDGSLGWPVATASRLAGGGAASSYGTDVNSTLLKSFWYNGAQSASGGDAARLSALEAEMAKLNIGVSPVMLINAADQAGNRARVVKALGL